MIYGDDPVKFKGAQDALGLNTYTYVQNIYAIRQSANLYAYCGSNPILFADSNGRFWHLVIGALVSAAVGTAVSVVVQLTTIGEVDFNLTFEKSPASAGGEMNRIPYSHVMQLYTKKRMSLKESSAETID